MELSSDLISIQNILCNLVKTTGDFTKIRYKGGNEKLIAAVICELEKHFRKEKYIINNTVNVEYETIVQQFLLFLSLNCEFKKKFVLKDSAHLIGIIPKLSKCLLANIIIDLNLGEYCGMVFQRVPFHIQAELLSEMLPCLKKSTGDVMLSTTSVFLKQVISQLNKTVNVSKQVEEEIEELSDISVEMLRYLGGLNVKQMMSLKAQKIFRHMGFTFLTLLELLQCCDNSNPILTRIVCCLLQVTCDVMKAVTVDVFCAWAEIEHETLPLQSLIASSAYLTLEKYQKYKPASELVQMLSTIARKPKSLQELVQQADATTMVAMIEKCDGNQQQWFHALTNTHIFDNQKSMECVEKYCYLCTQDDIDRILNMSTNYNNQQTRNLVLKCASSLPLKELTVVATRYFYKHGIINNLDNGNVRNQLVLLLNCIKSVNGINDKVMSEVVLLLLQNPKEVLEYLYYECLKNSIYSLFLKEVFLTIKEIVVIHSLAVTTLAAFLKQTEISNENTLQTIQLLNVLLETECITHEEFIEKCIVPSVEQYLQEQKYFEIQSLLYILNEIFNRQGIVLPEKLLILLVSILIDTRCTFFNFNRLRHNVARECVKCLQRSIEMGNSCGSSFPVSDTISTLNKFYVDRITLKQSKALFEYIFEDLHLKDYHKFLSCLVKILPNSVLEEWKLICTSLESSHNFEATTATLTDVLILLCHVAKSQSEDAPAYLSLDFCLECYGNIIKELISSKPNDSKDEVVVTKSVCRLLREMPKKCIEVNRCNLISLASDASLQNLSTDKQFVSGLLAIQDSVTAQMLAKRMLK